MCLILCVRVLGYKPDIIVTHIDLPCSVEHAVASSDALRDATQADGFGLVFPAAAAGLSRDRTYDVFVHGLVHPLMEDL